MLNERIQYFRYPAGKTITPFQAEDGDNYFMNAGYYFTYLGNYEEIGNIRDPWEKRSQQIQGAYVLNIFKRHKV